MKHEKFSITVDAPPATYVRGLAICLALGASFWAAIILLII